MDATLVVVLATLTFIVLALLKMPVGLSVAIAGVLGVTILSGFDVASRVAEATPFNSSAKYALFVIPMYILLGSLISNAGIGEGLYRAVYRAVRRMPGGLPVTAVVATALFSGISGSSAADVATFGRLSVREMSRHGYKREYAAAVVAAAGTFASLIPPSIALVVYAIIAEVPVGPMIVAGIIPGAISALALVVMVVMYDVLKIKVKVGTDGETESSAKLPAAPPPLPTDTALVGISRPVSLGRDLLAVLWTVIIFGIVVGGLYGGMFTATEAGAVGACAALIIALANMRSNGYTARQLFGAAVRETVSVTSMVFLLLIGGALFAYLIASSRIPMRVSEATLALPIPPEAVVAMLLFVLLLLGMFLDGLSILVLTVPVLLPVIDAFGMDPLWFGILVVKVIEIGLITPPVGINAFIISGLTGIPVTRVFRRLVPFVVLDIVVTALFFIFPDIILWLPRLAGLH